jgi:peptidoglycan hydrolase-like protein with peptidoglycan-binding domain
LKRLMPLLVCGPLLAIGSIAMGAGTASAQTSCSIGKYLTQGVRDSSDVKCLQQALNGAGFKAGPVDGWFGPVTRSAVVAFQTAKNLKVDGEVGAQTRAALGVNSKTVTEVRQQASSSGNQGASKKSAPAAKSSGGGTVWDRIAQCESGGNWAINTGNGYYGGLQFLPSSWRAAGGSGMPHHASREEQIRVAENLRAAAGGFGPWPACSAALGLR